MEPYENIEYYTAFQTSFSYRSELMIGIRWRKLLCDICDNENFVRQWLFFFLRIPEIPSPDAPV